MFQALALFGASSTALAAFSFARSSWPAAISMGISAISGDADFGSMARIANWDMTQPGLLMITARGGPRFRIVERKVLPDRLQTARVAWQPEPPAQPVPARLEAIVPLLRAIVEDAGLEDFPPLHRFDDATWVGYRMAEVLPIPHQARLRLLELDDPISRLEIIHDFLKQHKLID